MQNYSYLLHWICDGQRSRYVKIDSAHPVYLIITKMNGYIEESICNI